MIMSVLLVWRHWRNIVKLLAGAEPRIGQKVDPAKSKRRRRAVRLHQDEMNPSNPPRH
jgi:hypothetical protein